MKLHRSAKKSSEKPVGKTLVVLNIPPYVTEANIEEIFTKLAGQVERVQLCDKNSSGDMGKYSIKSEIFAPITSYGFKKAFIVFKKSESISLVMRSKSLPPIEDTTILSGVAKWTSEHNSRFVDKEEMQKEIDEYMQHYDKIKLAASQQPEEDDDEGWTVVGKQAKDGFQQKQSTISKLEQKIRDQKKKAKNLTNFYTFEQRESKKQQLLELRKKFENDKFKMQSIKMNRKFKPY